MLRCLVMYEPLVKRRHVQLWSLPHELLVSTVLFRSSKEVNCSKIVNRISPDSSNALTTFNSHKSREIVACATFISRFLILLTTHFDYELRLFE